MLFPYEESEPKYINDIIIEMNPQLQPDVLLSNRESRNNDGVGFLNDDIIGKNSFRMNGSYTPILKPSDSL